MKIKMELLSDVIFGNGMSIPGSEDVSVLQDAYGFPYYKGGTFKGIFREELMRYLEWTMENPKEISVVVNMLLGKSDSNAQEGTEKLVFSDFCLSEAVRSEIVKEIGEENPTEILEALTHLRTFTRVTDDGIAQDGTLRICRCVNKGLCFYSELQCQKEDEMMVKEILSLIKWVGSMSN